MTLEPEAGAASGGASAAVPASADAVGPASAPGAPATTLAVALVCYDESPEEIRSALDSVLGQSRAPAEVLIVDNSPDGRFARDFGGYAKQVRAIEPGSNVGYSPAVNIAAANATSDYLITLNPDAQVEPECLSRLAAVADSDENILLVGAQILLEDGATRNAGANPLHPTGISPAGGYGEPRERGEPRDVACVSGACCLIRREAFRALGSFVDEFFIFYDDPDMGWRALIAGMRVVYVPEAVAVHGYEFARRASIKWFYLERNRLFSVFANYEGRTLLLLAPVLIGTEIGLLGVAAYGGWLWQKLRSFASVFALRGRIAEHRRAVQATRTRGDAEVLELFDVRMDSALLPPPGPALANAVWVPYVRIVKPLLRRAPRQAR